MDHKSYIIEQDDQGEFLMELPESFVNFLTNNDIDPNVYRNLQPSTRRYAWLSPKASFADLLKEDDTAESVSWLMNDLNLSFYTLSASFNMAQSTLSRRGLLLGMDPASALAVANLSLSAGENVLDLCCAPGSKTVLCSHLVNGTDVHGSVTGVDISKQRLHSAVSLCKRFEMNYLRFFCHDGRTFDQPILHLSKDVCSICSLNPSIGDGVIQPIHHAIGNTKVQPMHQSTVYRKFPTRNCTCCNSYDKVLVDAQCTHDGSAKHVLKMLQQSSDSHHVDQLFDPNQLPELYELQYDLLCNGFRLLRPGGLLVYSTCSMARRQNQDIVLKFLFTHADAVVEQPLGPLQWQSPLSFELDVGSCLCIPMDAESTGNGAFFACRIRKSTR